MWQTSYFDQHENMLYPKCANNGLEENHPNRKRKREDEFYALENPCKKAQLTVFESMYQDSKLWQHCIRNNPSSPECRTVTALDRSDQDDEHQHSHTGKDGQQSGHHQDRGIHPVGMVRAMERYSGDGKPWIMTLSGYSSTPQSVGPPPNVVVKPYAGHVSTTAPTAGHVITSAPTAGHVITSVPPAGHVSISVPPAAGQSNIGGSYEAWRGGTSVYMNMRRQMYVQRRGSAGGQPRWEDVYTSLVQSSLGTVRKWRENGITLEVLYCAVCHLPTDSTDTLKQHIRSFHVEKVKQSDKLTCRACGERFEDEISKCDHEKICPTFRPYKCTVCGKNYILSYRLKHHQKTCGSSSLPCRVCNKIFSSKHTLNLHVVLHAFI